VQRTSRAATLLWSIRCTWAWQLQILDRVGAGTWVLFVRNISSGMFVCWLKLWTHLSSLADRIPADMAPPYGTCAPGDDQGFEMRNKISCSHALCLAYPGNTTHPGGCMHEGEIFTRWLQFGVFSSTFRTHCEACEIRVWMYPEPYRTHMFRTFHLRQALQPCLLPKYHRSIDFHLLC
jgi:hypothetical protein